MFKKKKGISFYELVVSLFLINLVLFSVLSVIIGFLKGARQVNENSKTALVANSIMIMRRFSYVYNKKEKS